MAGKKSAFQGLLRRDWRALEKIKAACGLPRRVRVENGPEFISRALDAWAYFNKIKLDCTRLGMPTDNPHIDSFDSQPSMAASGTNAGNGLFFWERLGPKSAVFSG